MLADSCKLHKNEGQPRLRDSVLTETLPNAHHDDGHGLNTPMLTGFSGAAELRYINGWSWRGFARPALCSQSANVPSR
jgi:hypothetical protein